MNLRREAKPEGTAGALPAGRHREAACDRWVEERSPQARRSTDGMGSLIGRQGTMMQRPNHRHNGPAWIRESRCQRLAQVLGQWVVSISCEEVTAAELKLCHHTRRKCSAVSPRLGWPLLGVGYQPTR